MVSSGDGTAPPVEDLVEVYDDAEDWVGSATGTATVVALAAATLVGLSASAAIEAGRTVLGVGLVTVVALLGVAVVTGLLRRR